MSQLEKFVWLLDLLCNRQRITLKEINEEWLKTEMSNGVDLSRQTLYRWRNAIEQTFDVLIDCDANDGYRYKITNLSDAADSNGKWLEKMLKDKRVSQAAYCERASRCAFKDPKLHIVVAAMQSKVAIDCQMAHGRNSSEGSEGEAKAAGERLRMEPWSIEYALGRWHVTGREVNEVEPKTLELAEIEDVTMTDATFELPTNIEASKEK